MKTFIPLLAVITLLIGCRGGLLPTAPTQASPTLASSSSVTFDANSTDSAVQGSEAQLTSFDGSVLTFTTTKGSFTAMFDSDTVFRSAQIDKYQPVDPCRQFAIDYNTGGIGGDTGGLLLTAIAGMASNGCLGRIAIDKSVPPNPVVPPNPIAPIRSFRPLAAF